MIGVTAAALVGAVVAGDVAEAAVPVALLESALLLAEVDAEELAGLVVGDALLVVIAVAVERLPEVALAVVPAAGLLEVAAVVAPPVVAPLVVV